MVLLVVLAFVVTRCYRILLRNIGTLDIAKVGLVATSVQFLALIFLTIAPDTYIPRDGTDIIFFKWFFAALANVFFVTAYRVVPRIYRTYRFNLGEANVATRTIIIGAGLAGKLVFDESVRNVDFHNRIVAFVDDDCNKIGGSISNVPVVGPISNAKDFIKKYKAEEVIIAISDLDSKHLREILALLSGADVKIRRMPLLSEMSGPNDRRVVDVNLDELLCRDPVELDNHEIFNMLNGKSVLITGAGGSIGSELTRQIFNAHPSTLVLFDIYENSTYDIQMELCQRMRDEGIKDVKLVTLIGSTYNETRLEQIFKKYHPDYIYHAAAYKHVPLMEDSPMEAIRTNVVGTYNVARLADKYKVKKMVLVSTDKAVRPTNTMGATKRFAETIIQYFAEKLLYAYILIKCERAHFKLNISSG